VGKVGKAVAQGLAGLHGWNRASGSISNEQLGHQCLTPYALGEMAVRVTDDTRLSVNNEDRAVQGASAVGTAGDWQSAMRDKARALAGESDYQLTEESTRLSEAGEKGAGALAKLHGWNRASAKDSSCIEGASHGIVSTVLEKPASLSARADEVSDTEPSKR
jgi:hypothetical protein